MTTRIQKKEIIRRVAIQTTANEEAIEAQLDAILDTLYEAFKAGEQGAIIAVAKNKHQI